MLDALCAKGAPAEVMDWPSMMTPPERVLLYRLAREIYAGDGIIVDAGLFLGASTNAFALGLDDNPARPNGCKPVQSYEYGVWLRGFEKHRAKAEALHPGFASVAVGDSYTHILQEILSPHRDKVELHFGDIADAGNDGPPIEIAFYDCLKNKAVEWAAFRALAPRYIPGRTIILQQDYFYERAIDLKIRQESLSPYMEFLGGVNNCAVFRCTAPIPAELFEADQLEDMPIAQKRALLDCAVARAPNIKHHLMARASVVDLLHESSDHKAVIAYIEELLPIASAEPDGKRVAAFLTERLQRALKKANRKRD